MSTYRDVLVVCEQFPILLKKLIDPFPPVILGDSVVPSEISKEIAQLCNRKHLDIRGTAPWARAISSFLPNLVDEHSILKAALAAHRVSSWR